MGAGVLHRRRRRAELRGAVEVSRLMGLWKKIRENSVARVEGARRRGRGRSSTGTCETWNGHSNSRPSLRAWRRAATAARWMEIRRLGPATRTSSARSRRACCASSCCGTSARILLVAFGTRGAGRFVFGYVLPRRHGPRPPVRSRWRSTSTCGRGIGGELIRRLAGQAEAGGGLSVLTDPDNTPANALYRSVGGRRARSSRHFDYVDR